MTSPSTPMLEEQLANLVDSLQKGEIIELTLECNRSAVTLMKLRLYLKEAFNHEKNSALLKILPSTEKELELLEDGTKLKSLLRKVKPILAKEIETNRAELTIRKNLTRKMLESYSKLGLYLKASIKEEISEATKLLDGMKENQSPSDFSPDGIDNIAQDISERSLDFTERFQSLQKTIIDLLPGSTGQELIEIIMQPQGVALEKLSLVTLQAIYNSPLKQFLRISLSE